MIELIIKDDEWDVVSCRRRNLKLWIDAKYNGLQASFIEKTDINQGELSALLKNKSFGEKKARSIELKAEMPYRYLDQKKPWELELTSESVLDKNEETEVAMFSRTSKSREINLDETDEYLTIKRVDFKLSAGISGYSVEYLNGDKAPIIFRRDWIESNGLNPEHLYAIKISGHSMETSLYDGDLVVVNVDDNKAIDGDVFAVNYEGELVIKRMLRQAGNWYLSSDNPDKRRYSDKLCNENCIVIGKVIYKQSERI